MSGTLARGAWSATVAQNFQQGYLEPTDIGSREVGSYSVVDAQVQYSGLASLVVGVGVRNAADRAPPVTNQNQSFQVGYDPTYADPRGRFWYLSMRYVLR